VLGLFARILILCAGVIAAVSPSSLAASPTSLGIGRAWGPGAVRGAPHPPVRAQLGIGTAYGPVRDLPSGARIAIGFAYGPIRVPPPCKRRCTSPEPAPSRVRR
jgi:hypothetical protein